MPEVEVWKPDLSSTTLRYAVRMTVAAVLASAITTLVQLPEGYWAVITAMIVMQGNLGGTLGAAMDRVLATIAGALIGVIGAWIGSKQPVPQILLLVLITAPSAVLAVQRPSFRVAPITAAMVLMIGGPGGDALHVAFYRLLEIAIGSLIGVATAHLVLPSRARTVIRSSTVGMLSSLGATARAHMDRRSDAEIDALTDQIRRQLTQITAASAEEARERAVRLTADPSPEPLLRTLRRLRSDVAMLGRVMILGELDLSGHAAIGVLLQAQFDAASAFLRQAGTVPDLVPLDAAIAATPETSNLQFALVTLRRDLADLGDRLAEYVAVDTGSVSAGPSEDAVAEVR